MNILERYATILNNALNKEGAGVEYFEGIFNQLVDNNNLKLVYVDFGSYGEKKLKLAQEELLKEVKAENYALAAYWQKIEQICIKHLELKKQYQITDSCFIYEEGVMLFCHTGSALHDDIIRCLYLDKYQVKQCA